MDCWHFVHNSRRRLGPDGVDVHAATLAVVNRLESIRVAAASGPEEFQTLGKQRIVEIGDDAAVART